MRALSNAPSAFASTVAEEEAAPAESWDAAAIARSAGEDAATFVAVRGDEWVGLVGAYRPAHSNHTIDLVSMWTAPEARRAGVARALVDAVLDWARQTGAERVNLWVTRGNDGAYRLYESMGFIETGEAQPLPSDPCADEIRMTLAV